MALGVTGIFELLVAAGASAAAAVVAQAVTAQAYRNAWSAASRRDGYFKQGLVALSRSGRRSRVRHRAASTAP